MTTVLDKWKAEADCSYSVTQCQRNKTKTGTKLMPYLFNVLFHFILTCFNLKDGRQILKKIAVMPLAQGLD